jgi:uncharacterized protein YjbJ (UPF0337 family)
VNSFSSKTQAGTPNRQPSHFFFEQHSEITIKAIVALPLSGSGTFRQSATCPLELTHRKGNPMGSTADKASGTANEAIGKAKQGIGEAVGSDKLQGEGAAQEAKGHGQKAVGNIKEGVKDAVNSVAGAVNRKL